MLEIQHGSCGDYSNDNFRIFLLLEVQNGLGLEHG